MKSSTSKRQVDVRPQFLAGDLALDFLNTRTRVGDKLLDLLQTDQDVLAWLKRAGCCAPSVVTNEARLSLLRDARELRENIRLLMERRKAGRRADPSMLNKVLSYAQTHPQLVWKGPRSLTIERVRHQDRPEGILAPIAEAAAVLLATADFNLVRRCEGEGCVLWFYDQTKSHRRRWCSTRICGNRHKVAAYRKRSRNEGAHG